MACPIDGATPPRWAATTTDAAPRENSPRPRTIIFRIARSREALKQTSQWNRCPSNRGFSPVSARDQDVHRQRPDGRCLLSHRWKVFQQFLRSLVESFLVFLLLFAGFKGMLGSTYPNELLCSRVIHAKDKSADVNR